MADAAARAVRDLTLWIALPRSRRARCQSATRISTARLRRGSRLGGTRTPTPRGSRRSAAHVPTRRALHRAHTGRRRIRIARC